MRVAPQERPRAQGQLRHPRLPAPRAEQGRLLVAQNARDRHPGQLRDDLGESVDVLCVKGSGWDLASIEPEGLPALRIDSLRALRRLAALDDAAMVNAQRTRMLDQSGPNPSVETLLHAFLPHKFVDHSHADAILALVDQPEARQLVEEVFGPALPIWKVGGLDEALERANASQFGLGSSIWTRDLTAATLAAERLEAGYTWINSGQIIYDELPFGGFGESGLGKEHGNEALDYYQESKAVVVKTVRAT